MSDKVETLEESANALCQDCLDELTRVLSPDDAVRYFKSYARTLKIPKIKELKRYCPTEEDKALAIKYDEAPHDLKKTVLSNEVTKYEKTHWKNSKNPIAMVKKRVQRAAPQTAAIVFKDAIKKLPQD